MPSYNSTVLLGNLVRDPLVKYSSKGMCTASFTVAMNDSRDDTPTYVDVTVFGSVAENAGAYLKKGRLVLVQGRLKQASYTDPDSGSSRTRIYVVGSTVEYLDKPKAAKVDVETFDRTAWNRPGDDDEN